MTPIEDVDTAVNMDSLATSAHRANAAGTEETANNSLDRVDNENISKTVKDEDATGWRVIAKCTHPASVTITDSVYNMRDIVDCADTVSTEDSADSADLRDSRGLEINDHGNSMDSAKDSNTCEGDADCTSESTCLEAMTPYGQDYYLRLGDTPRRRSALRLSRIIARQQLLRRLLQGRNREVMMCPSVMVRISVLLDLLDVFFFFFFNRQTQETPHLFVQS